MDNYIIANRTDVGKMRQVNEDSMISFDSPNGHVVAVCDGMGGQAAGDIASKLACDIIHDILTNNDFPTPEEAITRAVLAANQGILHRASQNPEMAGMGSTCVIMIINNNVITYGWVGDSRIYAFEGGQLRQLSRDQSYVQTLVDSGEITMEEAEDHPQKNEIINALGIEDMTAPETGAEIMEPGREVIFLLCSDGLSNMVNARQIERELGKTDLPLQEKADKLVFLANQYGGADNITVQLVEFSNAPAPQRQAPAPRRKAKKSNSMLVSIIAVVVLIIVCIGVYAFFSNNSGSNPARPAPKSQTHKVQSSSRSSAPKTGTNEVNNTTTRTTTIKKVERPTGTTRTIPATTEKKESSSSTVEKAIKKQDNKTNDTDDKIIRNLPSTSKQDII